MQKTKAFDKVNDSFGIVIVGDKNVIPHRDEKDYLIIGLKDFRLKEDGLTF